MKIFFCVPIKLLAISHRKNSIILSFRMLELSFRYLYKTYIMYFLHIYSKAVMHNGKCDIAFPKQSESKILVMVNKILDIYILLYFRGRLRSLAVLLDKCLLTDVFLFYKNIYCIQRHIFSNY